MISVAAQSCTILISKVEQIGSVPNSGVVSTGSRTMVEKNKWEQGLESSEMWDLVH